MSTTTIRPSSKVTVNRATAPAAPSEQTTVTFRPGSLKPGHGLSVKQGVAWPTQYKGINQGAHPGHEAWDIQAPQGSKIFSPVDGVVVKVVPMDPYGWGNAIQIESSDGKFHLYFGHLQSFLVGEGQQVVAGQEIGLADSTYTPPGFSSGSHLHFEVRDASGKAIDPQIFFNDESLTVPVDPSGPTITLGRVQQAMGASTTPAQNAGAAATAPATVATASPSRSSLGSVAAGMAAGALNVAGGTVTQQAEGAATVAKTALTSSPQSIVQSVLAGVFTTNNVAIIFGAIMLIVGVIQIGWKPVIKPTIEEGARVAGVAAKAAVAG